MWIFTFRTRKTRFLIIHNFFIIPRKFVTILWTHLKGLVVQWWFVNDANESKEIIYQWIPGVRPQGTFYSIILLSHWLMEQKYPMCFSLVSGIFRDRVNLEFRISDDIYHRFLDFYFRNATFTMHFSLGYDIYINKFFYLQTPSNSSYETFERCKII